MLDFGYLMGIPVKSFHSAVQALSYGDSTMKPFISLFVLGVVGFVARLFLRQYPRMIVAFIKRKFTISVTIVDDGHKPDINFVRFMDFYSGESIAKKNRRIRLIVRDEKTVRGPDKGFHWFRYEGKFYWFTVRHLESSGSEKEKSEVTISTYGVSDTALDNLISAFVVNPPETTAVYKYSNAFRASWGRDVEIGHMTLSDLVLPESIRSQITAELDWFLNNEQWYRDRFLDYKFVIMLHGEPGTGKSYLAKAIANYAKRSIYPLELSSSSRVFQDAVSMIPSNGIMLNEDFDDAKSMLNRSESKEITEHMRDVRLTDTVSLSTYLNVLQGINSSTGRITIMTTNHLEVLDPAIYRDSRVDMLLEIKALTHDLTIEYIGRMYSKEQALTVKHHFQDITAASLGHLFKKNPNNFDDYIKSILDHPSQQHMQEPIHLVAKQ